MIPNDSLFGVLRMPRQVLFGEGQIGAIGRITAGLGTKTLICTDARFATTEVFASILNNLKASGVSVHVFPDTLPDVPLDNVDTCVVAARPFAPDVVIGLGGGSCMDMAKCSSLLLAHGGKLEDYYGEFKVPGAVLPVLAVPTTSGTGSEVTPVAVVSDSNRTLKVGISSPHLIPAAALCDPELAWTCPPSLTAIAGADALTHAIEAFTAVRRAADSDLALNHVFVGKNAMSDIMALKAISLIGGNLERAFHQGSDRAARADMMMGAMLAGCAFGAAGTSLAHAIQYPIGALTHTPHGLGVAAMLPFAMTYNSIAAADALAEIATALGVSKTEQPTTQRADAAIAEVCRLFAAVGIPPTLERLGLPADKIDWTAETALGIGRLVKNNPRPIDLPGMRRLIRAAYAGDFALARQ